MVHLGFRNGLKLLAVSTLLLMLSGTLPTLIGATKGQADRTQCADGKDNDNDGRLDYPEDNDCENLNDDFEGLGLTGLFVSVTDGKDTVRSGGEVTYVITLRQQRDAFRNIRNIDLFLPFQANGVNASEGGFYTSGDRVHWDNVTVPKGATKRLTVAMNITAGAPAGKLLVARVIADGEEATETTLVDNPSIPYEKPLRLTVSDGKESIQPGESTTYKITLKNISSRELKDTVHFSLPKASSFVKATSGYEQVSDKVNWYNVILSEGETKVYEVTVRTDNRITDNLSIRGLATYGSYSDNDDTVVTRGLEADSIKVSISDNRDQVRVGDLITYNVSVRNMSDRLSPDTNIDASFPMYNEFVSATEGGYWDGKNVRWLNLPVAAKGVRNLQFVIRVRSDAPLGSDLLASVRGNGQNGKSSDQDFTTVVKRITSDPYAPTTVYNPQGTDVVTTAPISHIFNGTRTTAANVLFRKTANRSEATPGGTISYTISVRNTLDHIINNVIITDKFKTQHFTLADGQPTNGTLQWNVPSLRPGATWEVRYTLTVSSAMQNGWVVSNIATIDGADISEIPLSERIRVVQTGVLTSLPQTGAAFDALFLLMTGGFALGTTMSQRKKLFGL